MGGPEGGWGHKQTRASKYGGGGGRRPWGLVLTRKRFVHGAAALGGKLYVVGGYDVGEDTPLAEAEVFDPKADGWQPLPSMPTARRALAAAAVAGKVYAIVWMTIPILSTQSRLTIPSLARGLRWRACPCLSTITPQLR